MNVLGMGDMGVGKKACVDRGDGVCQGRRVEGAQTFEELIEDECVGIGEMAEGQ